MSSRSSTGSTFVKILVVLVLAVLVLIVAAEILLRVFIAGQMRSAFEEQARVDGIELTEEAEVSFGSSPLVFGLLTGKLAQVSMSTPSTLQIDGDQVIGQPAADLQLEGMQLGGDMISDRVITTTEVPDDFLLATMRTQLSGSELGIDNLLTDQLTITDVTSTAATQSIDVEFAQGLAVLTLTPQDNDGQLTFAASNAQVFGFDLPASVTEAITTGLQEGMNHEANLDAGMRIDNIEVVDGGLWMTMSGTNVSLVHMSEQSTIPGATPATP